MMETWNPPDGLPKAGMGDQLIEFLRSKRDQSASTGTDWKAEKETWIRSVSAFYDQVEEMLRESIDSGDVTLRREDMDITEDPVGTYSIPRLLLSVGGEHVEFRPMGLTVIGSAGRIDIRGDSDVVTLLREAQRSENGWTMVLQRVPTLRTAPVDRDTLKYALEQVMLPLS
jgi:hypothetical protein